MKNLSFFDKIIFFLNTLVALVLAISLLMPFVPTEVMPSLSAISLIVPFIVLFNMILFFYWLLKWKKAMFLSGILLLFWYLLLGPFYRLSNYGDKLADIKPGNTLSIMSYNVRSFNKYNWIQNTTIEEEIIQFTKEHNADIICFQEFSMIQKGRYNNYPYSYQTPSGTNKSFQIIFSKYPILSGESLKFPQTSNNGLYVDVLFNKDTLRIYDLHLQSFGLVPDLNMVNDKHKSAKFIEKVSMAMQKQYEQALIVRNNMDSINYKKIVVGDFNNTQFSNVYKIVKGDLQDTFLEEGSGFGRTYDLWKIPLRIDYILADQDFEILSHQNFDERLSDHYPVMATLRLNSHE